MSEVPGYEFEAPRAEPGGARPDVLAGPADSTRQFPQPSDFPQARGFPQPQDQPSEFWQPHSQEQTHEFRRPQGELSEYRQPQAPYRQPQPQYQQPQPQYQQPQPQARYEQPQAQSQAQDQTREYRQPQAQYRPPQDQTREFGRPQGEPGVYRQPQVQYRQPQPQPQYQQPQARYQQPEYPQPQPQNQTREFRRPQAELSVYQQSQGRLAEYRRPQAELSEFRQYEDPMRQLRQPRQAPEEPSSLARGAGGVLAAMRERNWVTGLAVPLVSAIFVGVAAVVVVGGGGGGGAAPSALAAGFPPARLAGADFAGATAKSPVVLDGIAASAATEVVAGSAGGGPALWVSVDGGAAWGRARLTGAAALTRSGSGQFAGVAHGTGGWLAVGATLARKGGPIVASSPDGQAWTVTSGTTALPGAGPHTAAAAAAGGKAGYVIVGHHVVGGAVRAAAWYAPGLTGWRRALITAAAGGRQATGVQEMNAVTVTSRGFTAVGGSGTSPAAWLSADGRTWQLVAPPLPAGAASATLTYVAASGAAVVAVGTEVSAAGESSPFAEVSADGGATWRQAPLPVPTAGTTATTVTALAATGGGFTATGTYAAAGGEDVAVWTLASIAAAGGGWTVATPQGTGLAGAGAQAITALTAQGATMTGVGFTVASGVRKPTLWQSPIRN